MPFTKIISENEAKMTKAVDFFHGELKGIRSGRASGGLVENVKVEYYGNPTPLKQLASISTPSVDMILIKPFDPAALKEIEKAIRNSDLSLAPNNDGKVVRLTIPPLSEERRKQLVHQVKQMGEQTKIAIRNLRRDSIKHLEEQEKAKTLTEDDSEKGKKQMDNLTKEYIEKIDSAVKAKSDEIMQG